MIHPFTAILIGLLFLSLLFILFWPKKGIIDRWVRGRLNSQRILLEDALKYLYDCEYKNKISTLNSVAGNMNISGDESTKTLTRLEKMGLISFGEGAIKLTDLGRSYALRIIRVHRIWERYLADETGIGEMEWHEKADKQEHHMSLEQADQLAAQIGNPVFDPHGDPIPSSGGEIPAHTGIPLSSLKKGDIATIVHVEDEPHTIYAQLVVLGLYPGMQIRVLNSTDEKIQFEADGEECVLALLFAENITVKVMEEKVEIKEKHELLTSLKIGEQAEIKGISPACRGQQRRRLMDFGIVPGTLVSAEMISASGDPTAYQIMGALIALRKDHADYVFIKRLKAS
ncbi:MAG: metal-dependent transcriptional regulator [Bacteroidetes bacterium]|nr:metal-dependent transcriptional regulator [Bacteroidota bacterium]